MNRRIVMILFLCFHQVIFSENISNMEILSGIKKNLESSTVSNFTEPLNWVDSKDKMRWPELVVTSEIESRINNIKIDASNRHKLNGIWDSLIVTYTPDEKGQGVFQYSQVKKIYNEIHEIFGNPSSLVDYGFLEESNKRLDLIAQWEIGEFCLTFRVIDMQYFINGNPGLSFVYLQIQDKALSKKIVPYVAIKLVSKQVQVKDKNNWREIDRSVFERSNQVILVIDYNNGKILKSDLTVIGDIDNMSSDVIFFSIKSLEKKTEFIFRLDRILGQINYSRFDDSGNEILKVSGYAEKVNLKNPLF